MQSLWRNTGYVLWLISDTSKGLATSLFGFAIPLITLVVTDDPAQAGIIAGVGMAVRVVTTLYGGVLADRHGRIALMLLGAVIAAVLAGGFTALALADALTFTTILVVEVLLMIRVGFFEPASESALKEIVPDAAMGRAQAANQGRDAALHLAGGPLGGMLLGVGGWLVGVVMTLCYTLAGATAWLLRRSARAAGIADPPDGDPPTDRSATGRAADVVTAGPVRVAESALPRTAADAATLTPASETATLEAASPAASGPRPRNAVAEIREGFTWLFSRPDLRGVLLVTTIVNLGFNTATTTVVYGLQQAGHSEVVIGWLSAAIGAVMLVGAFVAPLLVPRIGAGVITIVGLACTTVGAGVVSMAREPWAIAAVLGASVFLLPSLNASMMGYFMVATPTELLGRANSAAGVLAMGAMPLAPLVAGFGLTWLGREATIWIAAALCAASAVLAVSNGALRGLPAEAGWAAHAQQYADRLPASARSIRF